MRTGRTSWQSPRWPSGLRLAARISVLHDAVVWVISKASAINPGGAIGGDLNAPPRSPSPEDPPRSDGVERTHLRRTGRQSWKDVVLTRQAQTDSPVKAWLGSVEPPLPDLFHTRLPQLAGRIPIVGMVRPVAGSPSTNIAPGVAVEAVPVVRWGGCARPQGGSPIKMIVARVSTQNITPISTVEIVVVIATVKVVVAILTA